jgi:hypothetical protein
MSYSNRPSRRADPTVAPVDINPRTGEVTLRTPFSPSPHAEAKFKASAQGRKAERNRKRLESRLRGGR